MSAEIHFGLVFEQTFDDKTDKYVITNVGEAAWCGANIIMSEEAGKLVISPMPGTTDLSDIHRILDESLTLEQIIDGMRNYWGNDGSVPEEIVQILSERSKEKPRLLTK